LIFPHPAFAFLAIFDKTIMAASLTLHLIIA